MTISTILIIVLGLIFYFALTLVFLFFKDKVKIILFNIWFVLFLVVLIVGVFGKLDINKNFTNITFDFSAYWFNKSINFSFKNITKFDLLINLFMLIPVGVYFDFILTKQKFSKRLVIVLFIGLGFGLGIEFCQFMLPIQRGVQLSDALLNAASVIIGYLIFELYRLIFKKK